MAEAKVVGLPLHEIVAVYSEVAVMLETGVVPVTGAATPAMAGVAIVVAVAGNTAVTTPALTEFVAVAPDTVKKLAATPVKV